jgi:hypothetical protein
LVEYGRVIYRLYAKISHVLNKPNNKYNFSFFLSRSYFSSPATHLKKAMEGKSPVFSTYLPPFSFQFLANFFLLFIFSSTWRDHHFLGHPIGLFSLIHKHSPVVLFYSISLHVQTIVFILQFIYRQILHTFLNFSLSVLSLPGVSSIFLNTIFDAEILLPFPLISALYHVS